MRLQEKVKLDLNSEYKKEKGQLQSYIDELMEIKTQLKDELKKKDNDIEGF